MFEHESFPLKKVLAAIVVVAVSLVGILLDARWVTVAALLVWIAAMMWLGFGKRGHVDSRMSVDSESGRTREED